MKDGYPVIDHKDQQNIWCSWCGHNLVSPALYEDKQLRRKLVEVHSKDCGFHRYYKKQKHLTPDRLSDDEFSSQLENYLDVQVALRDMSGNYEEHEPRQPRETQRAIIDIVVENEIDFLPRKLFTKVIGSKLAHKWSSKNAMSASISHHLEKLESYGLVLRQIKMSMIAKPDNYKSFLVFDLKAIKDYLENI